MYQIAMTYHGEPIDEMDAYEIADVMDVAIIEDIDYKAGLYLAKLTPKMEEELLREGYLEVGYGDYAITAEMP